MIDWLLRSTSKSIEGKYSFHLGYDPSTIDSSSTCNATAYADKERKAVIPCAYKWSLVRNGLGQQMHDFKGSSFICQPNHIGCHLQAEITSKDGEHPGTAILTLGPIELDATLRTEISLSLSQRRLSQTVFLRSNDNEEKECLLRLEEGLIKIAHCYSEANYAFSYSISEPMIVINPKDTTRMAIQFVGSYESDLARFKKKLFNGDLEQNTSRTLFALSDKSFEVMPKKNANSSQKLQFRFPSRRHRDVFMLVLKAFIVKSELTSAVITQKIEQINISDKSNFDMAMEIHRLKGDLAKYHSLYAKAQNENHKLEEHIYRLQRTLKVNNLRGPSCPQNGCNNYSNIQSSNPTDYWHEPARGEEPSNNPNRIKAMDQLDEQVSRHKGSITSPFKKPSVPSNFSTGGRLPTEDDHLECLLEQINRSEAVHEEQLRGKIHLLESEKLQLQEILARANLRIEILERQRYSTLCRVQQGVLLHNDFNRSPQRTTSSLPMSNAIGTAINFTYSGRQLQVSPRIPLDNQFSKNEIYELKRTIEVLERENKRLTNELCSQGNHASEVIALRDELQNANRELESLKRDLTSQKEKCSKHHRTIADLKQEVSMFKRSADMLDRSQTLSLQLDNYNEEQLAMLKEQNELLANENEKLAKVCEKWMADAKQTNKLRQQILGLKEKLRLAIANADSNSSRNNSLQT